MNLPATRSDGQPRMFTPTEVVALGRCVMCEHHTPTQGHHYTCPAWPVWHIASGKLNRPYISDEVRAYAATPMPSDDDTGPDVLDLDVQQQGDQAP